jgi:hypothetical protein
MLYHAFQSMSEEAKDKALNTALDDAARSVYATNALNYQKLCAGFEENFPWLLEKSKLETCWNYPDGKECFLLEETGHIREMTWSGSSAQQKWLFQGNVFPTKEKAKIEAQKRETEALLVRYGGIPFRNLDHTKTNHGYGIRLEYTLPNGPELNIENIYPGIDFDNWIPFYFDSEGAAEYALIRVGMRQIIAYISNKLYKEDAAEAVSDKKNERNRFKTEQQQF